MIDIKKEIFVGFKCILVVKHLVVKHIINTQNSSFHHQTIVFFVTFWGGIFHYYNNVTYVWKCFKGKRNPHQIFVRKRLVFVFFFFLVGGSLSLSLTFTKEKIVLLHFNIFNCGILIWDHALPLNNCNLWGEEKYS